MYWKCLILEEFGGNWLWWLCREVWMRMMKTQNWLSLFVLFWSTELDRASKHRSPRWELPSTQEIVSLLSFYISVLPFALFSVSLFPLNPLYPLISSSKNPLEEKVWVGRAFIFSNTVENNERIFGFEENRGNTNWNLRPLMTSRCSLC